jgi:AcrR family transcriptional regulator
LRDLAGAVGMRAPSLYTYFPSKDAIYDAMFTEGYEAMSAFSDEIKVPVEQLDPVEALTLILEGFIRFCQASPARYQLMFTRAIPGWEPSAEAYAVSVRTYELMEETLGEIGITGTPAVDLYVAVAAGLAAQQMANEPAGDRWHKIAGNAAQMLVDHLDDNEGGTT